MGKGMFYVLSIFVIMTLCSCSTQKQKEITGLVQMTKDTTDSIQLQAEHIEYKEDIPPEMQTENHFSIYTLTQFKFQQFIQEPSMEMLIGDGVSKINYTQDSMLHCTTNSRCFPINAEFATFVTNKEIMRAYIGRFMDVEEIVDIAVIDVPNMPMAIWIKTTTDYVFMTISTNSDDEYSYNFYTKNDFLKKYAIRESILLVNGVEIKGENTPKTYGDSADIPMLAVLEALGATVEWQDETSAVVTYQQEIYMIDIDAPTFYKRGYKKDNLLYKKLGGATVIYSAEKDIMVDIGTLRLTLNQMDENLRIQVIQDRIIVSN